MQRKWISGLLALALTLAALIVMPAPRASAASGSLDFGTTADGTTATTGNTGLVSLVGGVHDQDPGRKLEQTRAWHGTNRRKHQQRRSNISRIWNGSHCVYGCI
ncbi:MAG: hypothetical protein IPM84_01000 [Anaerolineae bacterium]|nr:hypothetical protein [Anaerolineae bacterium]